ncbi:DUF481 domain-containing protein [Thalassotalea euphylliae]|uniref:DUF481 domain-containing protein n=1 Tax=Thalassotalea euphylliae TaxID=1655234 RepID=A0A3E0UHP5_9GAMM|nr:DUF481 domain-containing protein [Thalassotalea euphylliae]REL36386.1 DUF481 domain-containing protein [Thalassotalea euphylliae]
MRNNLVAIALCSVGFSAATCAQEQPKAPEHEYKASAELGFLFKTGNSKSGDIKTAFDFEHKYDKWTSLLKANLLYRKTEVDVVDDQGNTDEDFETSDQKLNINAQTNYAMEADGKNYMYGSVGYIDDRFSSFDYQATVSAGWGKKWYETEKSSLFADIGPGFKRDRLRITDTQAAENEDAFIVQAQALYTRSINEHVEFKQILRASQAFGSDENSVYRAETSITTKLIETLAMKFSFIVDHNTEVDEGKDKTDTETAITLVYSF